MGIQNQKVLTLPLPNTYNSPPAGIGWITLVVPPR